MKRIFVWVWRANGVIRLAEELAMTTPERSSGHFESEFEYTREWVSEPGAFALDRTSATVNGFTSLILKLLPVLDLQIGYSPKFPNIPCNEHSAQPPRLSCNHHVIWPDGLRIGF